MPTIDSVIARLENMKEEYGGDGDTPIAYAFWTPEDVHAVAEEEEGYTIKSLTEISQVLHLMMSAHDANIGLNWEVMKNALREVFADSVPEYTEDCYYVVCSICSKKGPVHLAHLHQGELIGECCWDERLRVPE